MKRFIFSLLIALAGFSANGLLADQVTKAGLVTGIKTAFGVSATGDIAKKSLVIMDPNGVAALDSAGDSFIGMLGKFNNYGVATELKSIPGLEKSYEDGYKSGASGLPGAYSAWVGKLTFADKTVDTYKKVINYQAAIQPMFTFLGTVASEFSQGDTTAFLSELSNPLQPGKKIYTLNVTRNSYNQYLPGLRQELAVFMQLVSLVAELTNKITLLRAQAKDEAASHHCTANQEWSDSQNVCVTTSGTPVCLVTQNWNTATKKCETKTCGAGLTLNGLGKCVTACAGNNTVMSWTTNTCTCRAGYDPIRGSASCAKSGTDTSCTAVAGQTFDPSADNGVGACACPSGLVIKNNTCVCSAGRVIAADSTCACPTGSSWHPIASKCTCSNTKYKYDNASKSCVLKVTSCTGGTLTNGACVCPANTNLNTLKTACISNGCTEGKVKTANGVCACPSGQTVNAKHDGKDICECPGVQTWDASTSSCSCPEGKELIGGSCQVPQVSCPVNQVDSTDGASCVCPVHSIDNPSKPPLCICDTAGNGWVEANGKCKCSETSEPTPDGKSCACKGFDDIDSAKSDDKVLMAKDGTCKTADDIALAGVGILSAFIVIKLGPDLLRVIEALRELANKSDVSKGDVILESLGSRQSISTITEYYDAAVKGLKTLDDLDATLAKDMVKAYIKGEGGLKVLRTKAGRDLLNKNILEVKEAADTAGVDPVEAMKFYELEKSEQGNPNDSAADQAADRAEFTPDKMNMDVYKDLIDLGYSADDVMSLIKQSKDGLESISDIGLKVSTRMTEIQAKGFSQEDAQELLKEYLNSSSDGLGAVVDDFTIGQVAETVNSTGLSPKTVIDYMTNNGATAAQLDVSFSDMVTQLSTKTGIDKDSIRAKVQEVLETSVRVLDLGTPDGQFGVVDNVAKLFAAEGDDLAVVYSKAIRVYETVSDFAPGRVPNGTQFAGTNIGDSLFKNIDSSQVLEVLSNAGITGNGLVDFATGYARNGIQDISISGDSMPKMIKRLGNLESANVITSEQSSQIKIKYVEEQLVKAQDRGNLDSVIQALKTSRDARLVTADEMTQIFDDLGKPGSGFYNDTSLKQLRDAIPDTETGSDLVRDMTKGLVKDGAATDIDATDAQLIKDEVSDLGESLAGRDSIFVKRSGGIYEIDIIGGEPASIKEVSALPKGVDLALDFNTNGDLRIAPDGTTGNQVIDFLVNKADVGGEVPINSGNAGLITTGLDDIGLGSSELSGKDIIITKGSARYKITLDSSGNPTSIEKVSGSSAKGDGVELELSDSGKIIVPTDSLANLSTAAQARIQAFNKAKTNITTDQILKQLQDSNGQLSDNGKAIENAMATGDPFYMELNGKYTEFTKNDDGTFDAEPYEGEEAPDPSDTYDAEPGFDMGEMGI